MKKNVRTMKKIMALSAAVLMIGSLTLTGCKKTDPETAKQPQQGTIQGDSPSPSPNGTTKPAQSGGSVLGEDIKSSENNGTTLSGPTEKKEDLAKLGPEKKDESKGKTKESKDSKETAKVKTEKKDESKGKTKESKDKQEVKDKKGSTLTKKEDVKKVAEEAEKTATDANKLAS